MTMTHPAIPTKRVVLCIAAGLPLALAAVPACAQFAPPSALPANPAAAMAPAPASPTYGYQKYDTANPKGFDHPDDQGYGTYVPQTPFKGHRAAPLNYRRFRGY